MNRYAAVAFAKYEASSLKEQLEFMQICSDDFKKIEAKMRTKYDLMSALKHICKINISAVSISREPLSIHDVIEKPDPLELVEVFLYSGEFTPDHRSHFCPLGHNVQVTKHRQAIILQYNERRMLNVWESISQHLMSPSLKNAGGFGKAILKYKNLPNQHVYFIKDGAQPRIKIGVSKHPQERLIQVSRQWGCVDAEILHVIHNGGMQIEEEMHEKFRHLRIKEDMGREWFRADDEIYKYIEGLETISE